MSPEHTSTPPTGATGARLATIRDVRDAARATGVAGDAVAFISREALPPAQVARLADAASLLGEAFTLLDTLADALASGAARADRGEGGEQGARDA